MDIEIGDRVIFEGGIVKLIYDADRLWEINQYLNGGGNQILKVERPNWEVVEEKKELLTEEEREFLKFFVKHYEVESFRFNNNDIDVYSFEYTYICCPDYPENMKFNGVEKRRYKPKELRIGGINNGTRRK